MADKSEETLSTIVVFVKTPREKEGIEISPGSTIKEVGILFLVCLSCFKTVIGRHCAPTKCFEFYSIQPSLMFVMVYATVL